MIINTAFKAARDRALSQCTPLVREGTSFTAALGLTAVQMLGQVRSASLDPFKTTPSLAAGLPHFTAGVSAAFSCAKENRQKLTAKPAVGSYVGT